MPELPQLTYAWDSPADDVCRVTLVGDLVNENADQLSQAVTDRLATQPPPRALHVDCAGVEMCDSRGLSVLLLLRRHTDALGVELRVTNRGPVLRCLLERTGTVAYLDGGTRAAALPDEETSG